MAFIIDATARILIFIRKIMYRRFWKLNDLCTLYCREAIISQRMRGWSLFFRFFFSHYDWFDWKGEAGEKNRWTRSNCLKSICDKSSRSRNVHTRAHKYAASRKYNLKYAVRLRFLLLAATDCMPFFFPSRKIIEWIITSVKWSL